jgi:hypothetical protein
MSEKKPKKAKAAAPNSDIACGIVMPISAIDNCTESHWADVQEILSESIEVAGFTPNLVSNADEVGIIQKRIIQNLYQNPVVVCDVSGKNPNVMFELGMRLAFDKPTIIVKDDKTSYTFDTSPIEHLEYPRDLRFAKIVEFKEELTAKIKATHEKATADRNYTTFLKHFGTFTVAKLDTQEVSKEDYILEELRGLRQAIGMSSSSRGIGAEKLEPKPEVWTLCIHESSEEQIEKIVKSVLKKTPLLGAEVEPRGKNHFHIFFHPEGLIHQEAVLSLAKSINASSRWLRNPRRDFSGRAKPPNFVIA